MNGGNFLELFPAAQSPALTSGEGFSPFLPHKNIPSFDPPFVSFQGMLLSYSAAPA